MAKDSARLTGPPDPLAARLAALAARGGPRRPLATRWRHAAASWRPVTDPLAASWRPPGGPWQPPGGLWRPAWRSGGLVWQLFCALLISTGI
eukprot:gene12897-biopygen1819